MHVETFIAGAYISKKSRPITIFWIVFMSGKNQYSEIAV